MTVNNKSVETIYKDKLRFLFFLLFRQLTYDWINFIVITSLSLGKFINKVLKNKYASTKKYYFIIKNYWMLIAEFIISFFI